MDDQHRVRAFGVQGTPGSISDSDARLPVSAYLSVQEELQYSCQWPSQPARLDPFIDGAGNQDERRCVKERQGMNCKASRNAQLLQAILERLTRNAQLACGLLYVTGTGAERPLQNHGLKNRLEGAPGRVRRIGRRGTAGMG